MNIIDKNFNIFTNIIKGKTTDEVFNDIKNNFFNISPEIQRSLEDYFKKFNYWGVLDIETNNYEELYNRTISLKEHLDEYIWLYNRLGDYRSKKTLFAILNNWYQFDFLTLNNCIETNYPHYFDLDIIKCDKNEVFVDLGAYNGDTILDYLNFYGNDNYKKMYAYEITEESFKSLKDNFRDYTNIILNNKAVSDKKEKLYIHKSNVDFSANTVSEEGEIEIEATTIDNDIKEPISLIKMDIEGFEQKALKGCEKHIKSDKPKLLISVYHNHEDLWKIPVMIDDICPNYKFYLRYYGNNIFPTEVVLIAIHEEK